VPSSERASIETVDDDFEDLFDHAPCGYLLLSPGGRIARANRTIADWTGFEADDLIGRRIHDVLQFAAGVFLETHILPLLRMQGSVEEVALDFKTAAGGKLLTLANATERRDASGRHLSTRLVVLKAIDRRKYERELVAARDQAEGAAALEREASELREQFIAVLGHDLRNPLASITSGIRMLDRETVTLRGKRVLTLMEGSVVRASALIDNVLDFARGRLGGGLTLSKDRDAPLEAILEQVIDEVRVIAPDRTIETHLDIKMPVPCDPVRIGQLVSNLLGNALTHGAKDQPVRVACVATNDRLDLWISNGGKPIPAEQLGSLFQPFFRGENSRDGLGLGLFIASQIALAHDGELTATSSERETRFSFTMPLN
jgi:sigma-B regulation protein RsbU (phosphoserine phosphatase)